jgi:poly(3-hydroxybutyrate) depolymerase
MTSNGTKRTYYLFVPDSAKDKPAPLIVLLHGSGRDGRILVDHWQSFAKKEGIILAGPDATVRDGWGQDDGPWFFKQLVESVQGKATFDVRRVYLFGHSAGAIHGLSLALLESEYFAALAVHAGALSPDAMSFVSRAPRKIPIALWVGTNDAFFPLDLVRTTNKVLDVKGFKPQLTEIPGHSHDYYSRSSEINLQVWAFLQDKRLDRDPTFQDYLR